MQGFALLTEEERPSWGFHPCPLDQPGLDGADFVAPQRVSGGQPPLKAGDVEDAALDVHLLQHQAAGLGDPEAMTKHQQH